MLFELALKNRREVGQIRHPQLEEEARRAQGGLGDPHGGAVRGIDGAAIVMTIARTYLPLRLNTTH